MKIITILDCRIQEGNVGETVEAAKKLADFCNKAWPESKFSVWSPRSGYFGRVVWVEEMPSLAAKEKWEEERGQKEGFNELLSEAAKFVVFSETTVNDFHVIA